MDCHLAATVAEPPSRLGFSACRCALLLCLVLALALVLPASATAQARAPQLNEPPRQQMDNSCGLAALAWLMTLSGAEQVSEAALRARLTPQTVAAGRALGYSLGDLHRLASHYGFQARAVRLTAPQLAQLTGPFIAHLIAPGRPHFVVVESLSPTDVTVADPAHGRYRLATDAFLQRWSQGRDSGIVFYLDA